MTTTVIEAPGVAPLALSEAGSWLCGRHPMLRELVKEIGAWSADGPEMVRVRDAVIEYDKWRAATSPVGHAFPSRKLAVRVLAVMSPSAIGRLRLLATLAPGTYQRPGLQFCIDDLATFDRAGKELIADWLRCIRVGVIG